MVVFNLFLNNNVLDKEMGTLSNVDSVSPDWFACTVCSAPVKAAYSQLTAMYPSMWLLHCDLLRIVEVSSQVLILVDMCWLSTQHIQEERSQGNQWDLQSLPRRPWELVMGGWMWSSTNTFGAEVYGMCPPGFLLHGKDLEWWWGCKEGTVLVRYCCRGATWRFCQPWHKGCWPGWLGLKMTLLNLILAHNPSFCSEGLPGFFWVYICIQSLDICELSWRNLKWFDWRTLDCMEQVMWQMSVICSILTISGLFLRDEKWRVMLALCCAFWNVMLWCSQ